jgi:acyl-CoA thioesterase I
MMTMHPEWEVLNRGVNGERSDQIAARFDRDVLQERPDVTVVLAGVNDVYQGFPKEFTERNLRNVYSKGRENRIILVTATILPYNTMSRKAASAIRELNEWIAATSVEFDATCADTNRAVADPNDRDRLAGSPDGLHPGVEGYRRMGEVISRAIQERMLDPPV